MNRGLVFRKQFVKNFQSLGDIEFPLEKIGMVAIRGRNLDDASAQENGVGKTSLLDSIVCTLYGRIPRYVKPVKGSQIVNRHGDGGNCSLELYFTIGKNDYRLCREYGKSRGHKLQLFQNDENISESSIPKTQDKVVQLVGTYQAFLNSIMFGRGVISRFVRADKVERGEIIASLVMDTESFDAAQNKTEKAYSQAQSKLSAAVSGLESAKAICKSRRENVQLLMRDLKELQIQNRGRLHCLKPPKPVKDVVSILSKKIQQVVLKIDRLKRKQSVLKEQMSYASGKIDETKSYYDILELIDGSQCPVCLTALDSGKKRLISKQCRKTIRVFQKEYEKKKSRGFTLRDKIIVLETRARNMNQHLDTIKDGLVRYDLAKLAFLSAKSALAEQEVKMWEHLTHARVDYKDGCFDLKKKKSDCKNLRQDVKDFSFLRRAFSSKGIMAEVVKTVCPKLTTLSQQFVTKFLGGGYHIEFVPELVTFRGEERLSFDIHASVEMGGGEYAACSDGEQERIDTCVGLALRYLVASRFHQQVNLLAFDERFSGLDTLGSEKVMELITEEARKQSSVLVITHQEHLQQFFEKQWVVVKERGVARLEMG